MKKFVLLLSVLLAISTVSFAQKKSKKLSADESAKMTADQRYVYESNRKSKGGKKKDASLKKKIRTEEKQDRKARKIKGNRRRY
jgi:hypothetical protein